MEILRALRRLIAGPDRRPPPTDRLPAFLQLYGAPLGLLALVGLGLINGAYLVDTRGLELGAAVALSVFTVLPVALAVAGFRLNAWRLAFPLLFIGVARAAPTEPWPWSTVQIVAFLAVFALLALRESSGVIAWAASFTIVPIFVFAPPANAWGVVVLITAIALAGDLVSRRRRTRTQLAEQTMLTEWEKDRRAVLEERARIAREMHDVVAHHMSMIAVQAETAPYRVPGVPASAEAEFRDIAASARAALTDMRRLLGVLRAESDQVPLTPQPALSDVPALVESAARAGMPVTLHQSARAAPPGATGRTGQPMARVGQPTGGSGQPTDSTGRPTDGTGPPAGGTGRPAEGVGRTRGEWWSEVPTAIGLAAYRTVQEALANAARHAPGGPVTVSIRETATALLVEIRNEPGNPGMRLAALPTSALPASALPASALPASALPASALPASLDSNSLGSTAPTAQALDTPAGVACVPVALAPGPLASGSLASEALGSESSDPNSPAPVRLSLGHGAVPGTLETGAAGGHGLTGMRERAEALGGTLDAGPQADGGYLVVARLPLDRGVPSSPEAAVPRAGERT